MKKVLESCLLGLGVVTFWILSSMLLFPHVKHDVCTAKFGNTDHQAAMREVFSEMSRLGLPVKQGCSYKSVKLSWGRTLSDDELAETKANGITLDKDAMTFVPLFNRLHPKIEFAAIFRTLQDKKLFQLTLVHEIGHVLGLEHVRNSKHIMYPYINDDISLEEAILQIKELSNVR